MKFDKSVIQIAAAAAIAATAALPATSFAQAYPNKPVKIIVPFAPGGTTDTMSRLSGASLSKTLNQPFVIENRPGGFTLIGTDVVAKAAPDGYTLGVQANSMATEQVLNKDWTLRIDRDIAVISTFAGAGYSVSVSMESGIKSLKDLVSVMKANPGKYNQGQAGSISPDMAVLLNRLGVPPLENILYKGGALATQALTANEVQLYGASTIDVASLHKSGKVRVIAYTDKERDGLLPEIPTVAESGVGLNDFEAGYWFAMIGQGALPADIVGRLNTAMLGLTKDPEFVAKATTFGMRVYSLNAAESRARVLSSVRLIEQAVAAGIKLR